MLPTFEERLDSVIRALDTVVLTSLPEDAKLAIELTQLSIGHLSIMRDQLSMRPAFEREELELVTDLAKDLLHRCDSHNISSRESLHLKKILSSNNNDDDEVNVKRMKINAAVSSFVESSFKEGSETYKKEISESVIKEGLIN